MILRPETVKQSLPEANALADQQEVLDAFVEYHRRRFTKKQLIAVILQNYKETK